MVCDLIWWGLFTIGAVYGFVLCSLNIVLRNSGTTTIYASFSAPSLYSPSVSLSQHNELCVCDITLWCNRRKKASLNCNTALSSFPLFVCVCICVYVVYSFSCLGRLQSFFFLFQLLLLWFVSDLLFWPGSSFVFEI